MTYVYLVIAYDQYYPSGDNTQRVFCDKSRARDYARRLESKGSFDFVDIVEKEVE